MSSSSILLQQIDRNFSALKKECGSWGKKTIKNAINQANEHIKDNQGNPFEIDLDLVSEAFFIAFEQEYKTMGSICLDYFSNIFCYSSVELFPRKKLVDRILKNIFSISVKNYSDSMISKCCKITLSAFQSISARFYIHSSFLSNCFSYFIYLLDHSEGSSAEIVSLTLQQSMRTYIDTYNNALPIPSINDQEKMCRFCVDCLVSQAMYIVDSEVGFQSSKISDIDLYIIIRTLCKAIEEGKHSPTTTLACCETILLFLQSDSPFLKTEYFVKLLQTEIHVALLALCLHPSSQYVFITSSLILLVWEKFPTQYIIGFNDLIVKGIVTALASPDSDVVIRATQLFSLLSENPQLLVDAFVNYDCDQSGRFRNIFQNVIDAIVKHAYPDQVRHSVQIVSLRALVLVLSKMWEYFKKNSNSEKQQQQGEAQGFLDAKKAKDVFDQGIQLFKRNEKKGLRFFIEQGIVKNEPTSISSFFWNTPALDPASIGQIIGNSDPTNVAVLKSFVSNFNFRGMSFEQAFRSFLTKFMIPGEAQMIDRIMEQFGSKYYEDNKTLFSCADTVYVLAFSALMLHTDAHHPTIKKHMTLNEFILNNAKIDAGKDLPVEFLTDLYNGITKEKIFIQQNSLPNSGLLNRQQQAELYNQQCVQALQSAREGSQKTSDVVFHRSVSALLIGPMFKKVWQGILGALTITFEKTESDKKVAICLSGLQHCLHIASHCYIEDALDILVDSFTKFTRLRSSTISDVKIKNISCTNALIASVLEDQNYLKGVWSIVLGEISALDMLKDNETFVCNMTLAEELFTRSSSLDREGILDFITALCSVSKKELEENPPRLFSLLKLTEIAHWNMDRPQYIWKEIWGVISQFLYYEGTSNNESIAMTTIDMIRQLAIKFIPKQDQERGFHFQSHFLHPYLDIFTRQENQNIKDTILTFIQQLVDLLANSLYSGWVVIFQILTLSAMDENLKKRGFSIVEEIVTKHMKTVLPYSIHLMSVLSSFVTSDINAEVSFQATANFTIVANSLPPEDIESWECLLQSIGKCNQHRLVSVKKCAEEVLLSILSDQGAAQKVLADEIWRFLFDVSLRDLFVFPEDANSIEYQHNEELIITIFNDLVLKYSSIVSPYTTSLLNFVVFCCQSNNYSFSALCLKLLHQFVIQVNQVFENKDNLNHLLSSISLMYGSCYCLVGYSQLILEVIKQYKSDDSVFASMLGLLIKISLQLEKENNETCVETLVSSLESLFEVYLIKKMVLELSQLLPRCFTKFIELTEQNSMLSHWEGFIKRALSSIVQSDDCVFKPCVDSSIQLLCKLIESQSSDVRKEIIRIMNRKLDNK